MSEHVQQSIKVCDQRLFLLCQLKKMGMSCDCLTVIFRCYCSIKTVVCISCMV